MPTTISWIQATERVVGQNHPLLADVANRPLNQVMQASGFASYVTPFNGFVALTPGFVQSGAISISGAFVGASAVLGTDPGGGGLLRVGGAGRFTGIVTFGTGSPSGTATIGSAGTIATNAEYAIQRRDTGVTSWLMYSQTGDLGFYDSADRVVIKAGGEVDVKFGPLVVSGKTVSQDSTVRSSNALPVASDIGFSATWSSALTSGGSAVASFYGDQTAATSGNLQAVSAYTRLSQPSGTTAAIWGVFGNTEFSGAGTVTDQRGGDFRATLNGSGTVTRAAGMTGRLVFLSGSPHIVEGASIYLHAWNLIAGTPVIDTAYGILIENVTLGTVNYAIKTGLGKVALGDILIVGTDPGGAELVRIGGNLRASGTAHVFGANAAVATSIALNAAVPAGGVQGAQIQFNAAGVARWIIRIDGDESGGTTGSVWNLIARDDAGFITDRPIIVPRIASGQMTLSRKTRFDNSIGIATDPVANALINMNVQITSTAGASQAVIVQPTFDSTTTVSGYGLAITLGTQAASFTLAELAGINIADATKGAGSTITNQYGLKIANQTKGATNWAIYTDTGLVRFGDEVRLDHSSNAHLEFYISGARKAGLSVTAADIIRLTDSAGTVKAQFNLGGTAGKFIPPSTSFSLRNNADNADNLLISDAGVVTIRDMIQLSNNKPLAWYNSGGGTATYSELYNDGSDNFTFWHASARRWYIDTIGDLFSDATNGGKLVLRAGASGSPGASMNIPHGSAPASPQNGDVWTTTAGIFVRINGTTVGPLS